MNARMTALKERAESEIEKARTIAQKAHNENRQMTSTEQDAYDLSMKSVDEILDVVKSVKADDAVLDQVKSIGRELGIGIDAGTAGASKADRRINFKAMGKAAAGKFGEADGQKALAANNAAVVRQEFKPDPIALGRIVNSILDVLPTYVHGSPEYSYMRQGTRTNNAAVVADGAVKPTSVYGVTRVENSLSIIAHLSEGVSKYWFQDNASLETFLAEELDYGLGRAIEAKVLADVNATSGIQTQAFSTSVLQTLRKTLTKLEVVGLMPSAFILHPTDWEALELLLTSEDAVEYRSLPFDANSRRLWGVPLVSSVTQTAGVSHTLAAESVALDTDGSVDIEWSKESNAEDFSRNLLRARCETRVGTSVFRPLGVVVGDLTA